MKKQRIRLQDVAARAGVSEATVSRVVNDRPGVKESTRREVRRLLDELGHEPPGLRRRGASGLVGLVVPELDNPVFPAFAQRIEARLSLRGYTTVVCSATRDGVTEDEYVNALLDRDVAGFIIVSGRNANAAADHGLYRSLVAQDLPLVLVNGVVPELDVPFVSCDDRYAGELAVRHLASLGHTRIGCVVGPRRYVPVQRRLEGFASAIGGLEEGLDPDLVVEAAYSVEGGHAGAHVLLPRGVTAIVAASDLMALGAIRAAREQGSHVPRQVSVIGFDDSPLMAFTDPALTTIRQPVRAMSETAVRLLTDRLQGLAAECHEYVFRPELVVRGSTWVCKGA